MSDYTIAEDEERPDDLTEIKRLLREIASQRSAEPERPRGWRAWLCLWTGWGPRTAYETALEAKVDSLRRELQAARDARDEAIADHNALVSEHSFEVRKLEAEIEAASHEVKLAAEIHERDRLRIQAEQADYAVRIGQAGREPKE